MTPRLRIPKLTFKWSGALIAVAVANCMFPAPAAQAQVPDTTLEGRYQLAQTYVQAGQFDRAITLLEDLSAAQPSNFIFYDKLLEAYESVKRYEEAIRLVDSRIQKEPQNAVLFAQKGRLLYLKGDEPGATQAWDDAIAIAPENRIVYRVVYQSMYDVRLIDRAIEVLERGRKAIGKDSSFETDLAYLYNLAGRHEEAMREYLTLLEANERQLSFVRTRLNQFLEDPKVIEAGIAASEQAMRRAPGNKAIRELLSWLYLESGDYQNALNVSRAIDRMDQESGRVLFSFAQSAADAGAYDAASEAFAEIAARYPDSPAAAEAQFSLAMMHEEWARAENEQPVDAGGNRVEAPHYEQALAAYRTFTEKYPAHVFYPEALRRVGILQLEVFQDLSAAESVLKEVIGRYAMTEAANTSELQLGRIALLRDDLDQAALVFSRLIERLGNGELADQARYELALVHFYKSEFQAAQALTDAMIRNTSALVANDAIELKMLLLENTGPDSLSTPLRAYARAHLLERQRRPGQALAVLDSLLARSGSHALADESRFLRARALRSAGRAREAVAAFGELPLLHPDSFLADRSLFMAAEILDRDLADHPAAVQMYTKLLADYPGTLYAADARARIRLLRGGV